MHFLELKQRVTARLLSSSMMSLFVLHERFLGSVPLVVGFRSGRATMPKVSWVFVFPFSAETQPLTFLRGGGLDRMSELRNAACK